jgi:formamidopyrimidine-DNA glycosylase
MPEIPELEAIRGFFNDTARLPGRTIAHVETRIPPIFRTPASELRETLPGDTFGEVLRHGKFLLFPLASGRVLAINPMLTGRFQYVSAKTKPRAKTCLIVGFAPEPGGTADPPFELRYADDRLMGKVYLVPSEQLALIPNWATNGPDLLDPAFTEERWLAAIKRYRGQIKGVLTNAAQRISSL